MHSCLLQRESFDVIGKVGFGRDFQASKDIDDPVNTFQQLTDDLEESVHRLIHPWRKYSMSKVSHQDHPVHFISSGGALFRADPQWSPRTSNCLYH